MENAGLYLGLSKWFYLGCAGILGGIIWIYLHRTDNNKSKNLENAYLVLILGFVGVLSEFTDFASVLFVFILVAGFMLLLDKFILSKHRANALVKPHYIHYSREFITILVVVWVLRAFLFEAYQIPSSSMRPGLVVGDFILVNKFEYGIKAPFTNDTIIKVKPVARGDIIVFSDPDVHNRDLIKRVVGIPGDVINYNNKQLTINGQKLEYTDAGNYSYSEKLANEDMSIENNQYEENLLGVKHKIITWSEMPNFAPEQVKNFPLKENCTYTDTEFTCKVPAGHYFMMGDNRDNSLDSRYWGFIDDKAVLGHAFLVWLNLSDMSRVGTKVQ